MTSWGGEVVKSGAVEVTYVIRVYEREDGTFIYDWIASTGEDADEWSETIEDAERDARQRLGD